MGWTRHVHRGRVGHVDTPEGTGKHGQGGGQRVVIPKVGKSTGETEVRADTLVGIEVGGWVSDSSSGHGTDST